MKVPDDNRAKLLNIGYDTHEANGWYARFTKPSPAHCMVACIVALQSLDLLFPASSNYR